MKSVDRLTESLNMTIATVPDNNFTQIVWLWNRLVKILEFCCLVCGFISQSTAMVMSRWSVNLKTHFSWARVGYVVNQYSVHILLLVTDNQWKEKND